MHFLRQQCIITYFKASIRKDYITFYRQHDSSITWIMNSFDTPVFPTVIKLNIFYDNFVRTILWNRNRKFIFTAFNYRSPVTEYFKSVSWMEFSTPINRYFLQCCTAIHGNIVSNNRYEFSFTDSNQSKHTYKINKYNNLQIQNWQCYHKYADYRDHHADQQEGKQIQNTVIKILFFSINYDRFLETVKNQ